VGRDKGGGLTARVAFGDAETLRQCVKVVGAQGKRDTRDRAHEQECSVGVGRSDAAARWALVEDKEEWLAERRLPSESGRNRVPSWIFGEGARPHTPIERHWGTRLARNNIGCRRSLAKPPGLSITPSWSEASSTCSLMLWFRGMGYCNSIG